MINLQTLLIATYLKTCIQKLRFKYTFKYIFLSLYFLFALQDKLKVRWLVLTLKRDPTSKNLHTWMHLLKLDETS